MDPVNFTAFREAERRFKSKAGHVDLTGVLDLRCPSPPASLLPRRCIVCHGLRQDRELWMYEIAGAKGCFVIPDALDEGQQKYWIARSLSSYLRPPNATNLDAHYRMPEEGLWPYYAQRQALHIQRIPHADDSAKTQALPLDQCLSPDQVEQLIRRIRWATLGYQYDWTTKEYNLERSPVTFPADLSAWSRAVCEAAGFGSFSAEAGIVNFYQQGDTLTGHVDRSEPNTVAPLISLSLGASCIFLLGGASREDPVTPLLLRGGDVMLMTGPSRLFYHGVPRIIFSAETRLLYDLAHDPPEIEAALRLLGDARININIRQVHV